MVFPACLRRCFVPLLAFLVVVPGAGAETVLRYDMEIPFDWSDVSMEWGTGGKVDFAVEEPGRPGRALHMTTRPVEDPVADPPRLNPCRDEIRGQEIANEGRCLQWNHEPGTPVRIAFDFRVFEANDSAFFRVYYYDGYVTAEFFQWNWDDPFYRIPDPVLAWNAGDERGWTHYEVVTPPLEQPVITLWIQAAQSRGPGYFDAAIDNLEIELTPLASLSDPGLDWGGQDFDKMVTCRRTDACRRIPWCDALYDEFGPVYPGATNRIYYGSMNIFRMSTGNSKGGMLALKHDFWHRHREPMTGGASVIGLASIHGADFAKSMGIRQTVSYEAWGLKPGQPARIVVRTKAASSIPRNSHGVAARTLLGVDPRGDILGNAPQVIWSEEALAEVRGRWFIHRVEFDRPPDADALTIFLKWRDGQPGEGCGDRAADGNEGWFDWVLVDVAPAPEAP